MKLFWRVIEQANILQVKTFDRFKLGIVLLGGTEIYLHISRTT